MSATPLRMAQVFMLAGLAVVASCYDHDVRDEEYARPDPPCATQDDCPFYLTCSEGACRRSCLQGSCSSAYSYGSSSCGNGGYSSYQCRADLCVPVCEEGFTSDAGSGSDADAGPIYTDLAEAMRSDLRLANAGPSTSDDTNLYWIASMVDVAGQASHDVLAARLDGTGPVRTLLHREGRFNGRSDRPLVASDGFLFWLESTASGSGNRVLMKLPLDGGADAATPRQIAPSGVVIEEIHPSEDTLGFYVAGYTTSGSLTVLRRFIAATDELRPLDDAPSHFAVAGSVALWVRPNRQVMRFDALGSGAPAPTGATFPIVTTTSFATDGTFAYYTTDANALLRVTPSDAGPAPVNVGTLGRNATFRAGVAYEVQLESTRFDEPWPVRSFDLATGASTVLGRVAPSNELYSLRPFATSTHLYLLQQSCPNTNCALYRLPLRR